MKLEDSVSFDVTFLQPTKQIAGWLLDEQSEIVNRGFLITFSFTDIYGATVSPVELEAAIYEPTGEAYRYFTTSSLVPNIVRFIPLKFPRPVATGVFSIRPWKQRSKTREINSYISGLVVAARAVDGKDTTVFLRNDR